MPATAGMAEKARRIEEEGELDRGQRASPVPARRPRLGLLRRRGRAADLHRRAREGRAGRPAHALPRHRRRPVLLRLRPQGLRARLRLPGGAEAGLEGAADPGRAPAAAGAHAAAGRGRRGAARHVGRRPVEGADADDGQARQRAAAQAGRRAEARSHQQGDQRRRRGVGRSVERQRPLRRRQHAGLPAQARLLPDHAGLVDPAARRRVRRAGARPRRRPPRWSPTPTSGSASQVFHRALCECEFVNKKLANVDEYVRLQAKAHHKEAAEEAAYDAIGAVMRTESDTPRELLDAVGSEPVLKACALVGHAARHRGARQPGRDRGPRLRGAGRGDRRVVGLPHAPRHAARRLVELRPRPAARPARRDARCRWRCCRRARGPTSTSTRRPASAARSTPRSARR